MEPTMNERHAALLARNADGGGLSPYSLGTWDLLLEAQRKQRITGNFLEIGLWTGIGLTGMGLHLGEKEEMFGIDLFVQRDPIKDNFEAITGLPFSRLNFIQQSSMTVKNNPLLRARSSSFRFIHIDGEHSFNAVCSDLELAIDLISPEGIIAVDDFFNIGSAGITEAVYFMLARYPHRLKMFLAGMSKAYISSPRSFGMYRSLCVSLLVDRLEIDFDVPVTIAKNGHSTEIDYITFFPRIGNYK